MVKATEIAMSTKQQVTNQSTTKNWRKVLPGIPPIHSFALVTACYEILDFYMDKAMEIICDWFFTLITEALACS